SFVAGDVRTVASTLVDALELSADSVTAASLTADPSQGGGSGTPGTTVPSGELTVSLAASTPGAANIPDGTSFNKVLTVNLQAGADGATVTGLTLKKTGYLLNTDITGVDVVDGNGVRHGNVASSLNSDSEVLILFGSNPVVVPANGQVSLTVRLNFSADTTASTVGMSLKSLTTTATVSGSLPIAGSQMSVVDGSNAVAAVTIDVVAVGGSSQTSMNADADNSQEITKFRITETASKEDVLVRKLTLFNYGNAADADYKDVELVATDGTVLATAQPVSQQVVFDLSSSPYKITKGQQKDLTVRMKIVGGTTKTIQLAVYNDFDLEVQGADTGAYVLPTGGTTDGGAVSFPLGETSTYNEVLIASGTLSFNKDVTSPSDSVNPGDTNVVLAKYYAKPVGEDMELRKISFGIEQDDSALTGNVYVKVDGSIVWSGAASTFAVDGTFGSKTLTTYPRLKAGQNNYITVEGSVPTTATSGVYYLVNDFDLTEAKLLISNTISDASTLAVNATDGNQIQVNSASMTAKTLSTPVSQNIVNGTNDFTFGTVEFNAQSSGETVRVSSVIVSNMGSGTVTDISNLELWDGTTQLTTSNSTATGAASTTFTFTSPLLVTKGTIKTLTLKGDITGSGAGTHQFRLHSVSATGKDTGTSVSITPTGSGQEMTIATSGTVTLSLVSGNGGSPVSVQTVNIGSTAGTYFAFKASAQNEAAKVRTLKLTASGTSLNTNSLVNLNLYRKVGTATMEATPFASATEMTCSSNTCTYTWTATDNLLPEPIQPGTPVTIYVKADVGAAGAARLGDDFVFSIAATTTDFIGVGDSTNAAFTVAGTPTASGATHIVPWSVKVFAESPTAPNSTVGVGSGSIVGKFKLTNLGSGVVTFTTSTFNGSGSSSTATYSLHASTDGGASTDSSVSLKAASSTLTWGDITDVTLNGGSSRYLTIKTGGTAGNYDTHQWSVNVIGQLTYSVAETALGYDENADGDLDDTVENLYVEGTPALEIVTSRSS
ncbi:MAG: hypothetical protein CO030_03295, partial [Candidatus Magasanikbacteria bacterium CG_4_9_14_0_2_um_filter_42_11]